MRAECSAGADGVYNRLKSGQGMERARAHPWRWNCQVARCKAAHRMRGQPPNMPDSLSDPSVSSRLDRQLLSPSASAPRFARGCCASTCDVVARLLRARVLVRARQDFNATTFGALQPNGRFAMYFRPFARVPVRAAEPGRARQQRGARQAFGSRKRSPSLRGVQATYLHLLPSRCNTRGGTGGGGSNSPVGTHQTNYSCVALQCSVGRGSARLAARCPPASPSPPAQPLASLASHS